MHGVMNCQPPKHSYLFLAFHIQYLPKAMGGWYLAAIELTVDPHLPLAPHGKRLRLCFDDCLSNSSLQVFGIASGVDDIWLSLSVKCFSMPKSSAFISL
jgi:hypothetical protein